MKSAGVNIDEVIENVLAQRCDPLAGWWALLIEKEQRKEQKRERKRREREVEAKNLRRLSAASSRLEKRSSALMEVEEEGQANLGLHERGRRDRRSLPSQLAVPEFLRFLNRCRCFHPRRLHHRCPLIKLPYDPTAHHDAAQFPAQRPTSIAAQHAAC